MKAVLHSLVVLLVCSMNAWSSPGAPAEQVRQVIAQQQDAWNRGAWKLSCPDIGIRPT
jgi:hypothetical protein